MNESLLFVILLGTALTAVLAIILLIRVPSAFQSTAKEVRDELRLGREEAGTAARALREEVASGITAGMGTLANTLNALGTAQQTHLEGMTTELKELKNSNQIALDGIRTTLDSRVRTLQESNEKKLDEMRQTVDEKLGATLDKRLGEAFKQVSERLEEVHKGLGEMKSLATGVGDLKRVLTNVKVRGTWAEVQLGAILEQILTPDQYEKNAKVKPESAERVEYAIRLPGPKDDPNTCVLLPIDSKFPQEDYLRLQEAAGRSDSEGVQKAAAALAGAVRVAAKDIHDKYINPPSTTDFAVMFLATEGLYSEVLRQPGFVEEIQHKYRVVLAGPTTLAAILSSLRMGFQTLAIERRTAEVWNVLAGAKTEFTKFADVLDKVKGQLHKASETLEQTSVRSRAIERQLRSVEQLPEAQASTVLPLPPPEPGEELGPAPAH